MTLRSFHLFFITVSVLLTLFFGVFELRAYQEAKALSDALVSGFCFVSAIVLTIYGFRFWAKTRQSAS